jgi:4-amino-4-deoxy-L-arabinose transferase-like glycosyltransferase
VFVVAMVVRAVFVLELRDESYLGNIRVSDAGTYFQLAQQLLAGTEPFEPYWQAPLYPIMLSVFQFLFGEHLEAVQWLHIAIGSLNCVLIHRLTKALFGERAAWVAAGMAAFYAPFLIFDVQPLPTNLAVLLNLVLILSYLRFRKSGDLGVLVISGLVLGAAIVTHGLAIFTLPLFVYDLVRRSRHESEPAARAMSTIATFVVCALLLPGSVSIRNSFAAGTPTFVSYNAGINLYLGNSRDLEETLGRRGGYEWGELFRAPYTSGAKEPAAMNAFFVRAAINEWLEAPAAMLVTLSKKVLISIGASESKRNFPIYPLRESSLVLRLLLYEVEVLGVVVFAFPAGLVIPLALLGVLVARKANLGARAAQDDVMFPAKVAGFYLLGMLLFFPTARYRVPGLALLLPYAAAMAVRLYGEFVADKKARTRVGVGAISAVLLLLLVNPLASNVFRHNVEDRAEHLYYTALWAAEKLRYVNSRQIESEMVAAAFEAMRIDPVYPEPVGFLGVYYLHRDIDRAIAFFVKLDELVPKDLDVINQYKAAVAIRDAQP